ncbi:MAG: putative Zinc finger protein 862 [Streblomastix strix]|uniref:Putative Zinc finger protein 862 n=1 Tax=Streblomastix strix TaxID=222440 RepID=A0A5J4VKA6_9EUKA|nr:MAG: putative Zinc finger protein 862 [Streblomastix strix]
MSDYQDLDLNSLIGICVDGASNMIGCRHTMTSKIVEKYQSVIIVHCCTHRLNLASLDSINSRDLQPLRHAEAIVQQLWHFFVASPLHAAILAEIQSQNEQDYLKLKSVVPTRWLSCWESVVAAIVDLPSIWIALDRIWNSKYDSTANGLLNQTKRKQFILSLFILKSVLQQLKILSLVFQQGSLTFDQVPASIQTCKAELLKIKTSQEIIEQTRKQWPIYEAELLKFIQKEIEEREQNRKISAKKNDKKEQERIQKEKEEFDEKKAACKLDEDDINWQLKISNIYIDETIDHINKRLDNQKFISNFSIFNPQFATLNINNENYGNNEVLILKSHFNKQLQHLKDEEVLKEWRAIKQQLILNLNQLETNQACLRIATHPSYSTFPAFKFLAQACLTLPIDNCWPERGFSHMKRIKTPSRNRLGTNMLQYLMNIKMNGWPKLTGIKALEIAEFWYKEKDRRTSWKKASETETLEEQIPFEQLKLNINEVSEFIFE